MIRGRCVLLEDEKAKEVMYVVPLLVLSALSLLVDLLVGDSELFILVNRGMTNPMLDFACGYLSAFLFIASSAATLFIQFFSGDESSRRSRVISGLLAIASALISYGFGSLLKLAFQRPRPFEVLDARIVGEWRVSTSSFPSTTSMFAFGFALPMLYEKPRIGVILVLEALFIGFSVVYAGFHYPSDVIAGMLLSICLTLPINITKRRLVAAKERNHSAVCTKDLSALKR